jgi:hypothetical protein
MYRFRIRGARASVKDALPLIGLFGGAAAALAFAPVAIIGVIMVMALVPLAIMWWPGRIVEVTPYDLLLRRYKQPGQLTFATRISWHDVQEIFLAPRGPGQGAAATLVAGRRTPVRLDAVRAELPPGYDHNGLMAAIRQAAPNVPIHHMRLGDVLARTRLSYHVRLSPWWLHAIGFVTGVASALALVSNAPVSRFSLVPCVIIVGATRANVEITPTRLRFRLWQFAAIRWSAVTSFRLSMVDDVIEMMVASPGRERTRRLPLAAVDPAALETVVRAYAPTGTVAGLGQ